MSGSIVQQHTAHNGLETRARRSISLAKRVECSRDIKSNRTARTDRSQETEPPKSAADAVQRPAPSSASGIETVPCLYWYGFPYHPTETRFKPVARYSASFGTLWLRLVRETRTSGGAFPFAGEKRNPLPPIPGRAIFLRLVWASTLATDRTASQSLVRIVCVSTDSLLPVLLHQRVCEVLCVFIYRACVWFFNQPFFLSLSGELRGERK